MRVGFIGLGEAGSIYATAAVAAGHEVSAFDPQAPTTPDGVERRPSLSAVVSDTDLVIVLTGAALSERIADDAADVIAPPTIYADFTTAAPDVMGRVGERLSRIGVRFADIAILGSVPAGGAATQTIASGTAAPELAEFLTGLGSRVEVIDGAAGEATSRKLLRSVIMKSLAAITIEALEAGRAAGCEGWIRAQLADQLAGNADATIDRFEAGTRKHAERRAHEMESVVDYLTGLGVGSEMSAASRDVHRRLI